MAGGGEQDGKGSMSDNDQLDIRNRITDIRKMRLGDVSSCPLNWKYHPDAQVQAFYGIMREMGWAGVPIAYHSDIAGGLAWADGNMRGPAVPDLEADVAVTDLTDEEVRYMLLTFDPLAALAEADREALGALLGSVQTAESSVQALLGELAEREGVVFGNGNEPPEVPEPEIDRAEELQQVWQVKMGDVWQAGNHFVICGDCREPETWERLLQMAGVTKVNGVFTSPPYAEQRKQQYGGVPVDEYVDWWEAVQANVRGSLAPDGSFFVNIKPHCEDGERVLYVFDLVLAMKRRWGWRFVDELCWVRKSPPGKWDDRLRNDFESIFQFSLETIAVKHENIKYQSNAIPVSGGGRNDHLGDYWNMSDQLTTGFALPGNVIRAQGVDSGTSHVAAFPIALPDFFIRAYSDPGDVWCDPFSGSGTVIVAAHQNERRGLGIEKLEKYVSVSLERLTQMGLEPRRVE